MTQRPQDDFPDLVLPVIPPNVGRNDLQRILQGFAKRLLQLERGNKNIGDWGQVLRTTAQAMTTSVSTAISWNNGSGPRATISSSAGGLTVSQAGVYAITLRSSFPNSTGGNRITLLLRNGAELWREYTPVGPASWVNANITVVDVGDAGTIYQMAQYQSSGGTLNTGAGEDGGPKMRVVRIA